MRLAASSAPAREAVRGFRASSGEAGRSSLAGRRLTERIVVGILGDHATGAIGNIGDTVTLLMVLQIPTIWLVWKFMPETKGKELEQIAEEEGTVSTGMVLS